MSSNQVHAITAFNSIPTLVREWLNSLAIGTETLILAHTKEAADDLAWTLSVKTEGQLGLHRLTPIQLARNLAAQEMAGAGLTPISRLGLEALAARSTHRSHDEAGLGYFDPVSKMPGFARSLASTLSDLRLANVEKDALLDCDGAGIDLAILLDLYTQELQSQSLGDLATVLKIATHVHDKGSIWSGLPLILLDVYPQSAVELQFYHCLVKRSPAVLATILFEDKSALRCLETLLGVQAFAPGQSNENKDKNSLHRIREAVFTVGEVPEGELDASFQLLSAAGEGHECTEIVRSLLEEARQGTSFDRMAVLLRQPEIYQPQMEEALERAEIPAYFCRGTSHPNPSGRALLALLECVYEGLTASRFCEYLSLDQLPQQLAASGQPESVSWISPEDDIQLAFKTNKTASLEPNIPHLEDKQPLVNVENLRTPLHWESLLIDAAVISGKDRWSRKLVELKSKLTFEYEKGCEDNYAEQQQILKNQLDCLQDLMDFVLPLIDFLENLPHEQTWEIWLVQLRKLSNLALKQPETVLEVLAELEPMGKVGPVDLSEVISALRYQLSFFRKDPSYKNHGQVFVGTLQQASGRSFEVVYLPGLSEGIFPTKSSEDALLLDHHRQILSPQLLVSGDKIQEERLLLHTGLAAASRRVVASYPRMDMLQGRARVPSLYALELMRGALGRLPDIKELEQRAAEASSTRLGWSAPRDPENAIDDTEYDLATLAPLIHASESQVTGQGHYLLMVNTSLARSLRARYKRWNSPWSDDDGIFAQSDQKTRKILQEYRLTKHSYSSTALQKFSACPFQFFLHAIQKLRPRQNIIAIEHMDSLTRGSLFHQVQFQLYRRLDKEGLLPFMEERLDLILASADKVLDHVAGKFQEKLVPSIPLIWDLEVENLRVDLRTWIRKVSQRDQEWIPIHYEYSFGHTGWENQDSRSTVKEAVILDGIRLRGAIDLVEKHSTRPLLRITDHKTGKARHPKPQSVGKGETLQPLLYSLAAQELLGTSVQGGRLYYCTQNGDFQEHKIDLDQVGLKQIRQVLQAIDEAIEKAFFPAAPREDACPSCDYRPICGPYEEIRVRKKSSQPLESLNRIRELP